MAFETRLKNLEKKTSVSSKPDFRLIDAISKYTSGEISEAEFDEISSQFPEFEVKTPLLEKISIEIERMINHE